MTHAELARQAAAYLRQEADFNRSWTDGRHSMAGATPAYIARCLEIAEQRETWAASIEALVSDD
jgi:hypothetical protein